MIDLTTKLAPDGTLTWDVPEGQWTILRTGCTLNGTRTQRGPGNDGWDADPLRATAIEDHFKNTYELLLDDVGNLAGKTFRSVQIDSWEINIPNWTQTFLKDFRRYRGYDRRALSGCPFRPHRRQCRDYRSLPARLPQDACRLHRENYFGRLTALAHAGNSEPERGRPGLLSQGRCRMDGLKNLGRCDIPMGEFWQDGTLGANGPEHQRQADVLGRPSLRQAVRRRRSLHVVPALDRFARLAQAHRRSGLLRRLQPFFIFSTATQPGDGTPGVEFYAGTHFNRKITWWNRAKPFTDYLARCSHLLQQGLFVADVCYYNGDGAPNFVEPKTRRSVVGRRLRLRRLQRGSAADANGRARRPHRAARRHELSPAGLARAKRHAGRSLAKIRDLVAAGATVVGPKPERDPGLKDYPECDQEVKRLADELWGPCDGKTVTEHRFGKGRVIWGMKLRDILTAEHVPPDFELVNGTADTSIDFIHRNATARTSISSPTTTAARNRSTCTFRVDGKLPEFWDPVTGAMRKADSYAIADGRTTVPLRLAAYGSLFVVFRRAGDRLCKWRRELRDARSRFRNWRGRGRWHFDPKWGGPDS